MDAEVVKNHAGEIFLDMRDVAFDKPKVLWKIFKVL